MLHSGSRGIGNRIGTPVEKAGPRCSATIRLPDELACLRKTPGLADYVRAVRFAQDFARQSDAHETRVSTCCASTCPSSSGPTRNCHHNYVERETHFGADVWVTRKGAVRARAGELGIIPGSMGTKSFIVRGKGNHESFHSCSHGAGRRMSRGEAKRRITLEQHVAATAGLERRKDASVIDESPAAYKDVDAVIAAQRDLVEVVHTLKQVVCVKG